MDTIAPNSASPSLRVLLVEDSPDDAELLKLELSDQGYAPVVKRVESPEELARALDESSWDVVLCDHRLPRMNALSALGIVQARGLDLPFIIVSNIITETDAIDVMRAGAHDFLYKHNLGKIGAIIERETREAELRGERRRMQHQLLLADRLSSIGMLAAGVAHEINNPLAYVLGNIEFALSKLNTGSLAGTDLGEVVQALTQAREGSTRIGHITRDLKVFCRSGVDELKRAVDVRKVMESSISIAWNQIRHRARLTRDFERVPAVSGDENRLGQVFLNLLVNAAQSLPDDQVERSEIVVSIRSEANKVVIDVRDNGHGMSREQQARMFEPFFTTKPRGVGSGIGLSICRSIVADMGGEITCESQRGRGTTFRVRLPAQESFAFTTHPPRAADLELPRSRILVIDDEPGLCAAMRRLLHHRHEVASFVDAREALKLLDQGAAFDVIFCDIMMPYMSGIEFFGELKKRHPELTSRTVFMTGGAFNAPAQQFLRTVANHPLEKPFETRTLEGAIAQVLEANVVSGTWRTGGIVQELGRLDELEHAQRRRA